MGHRPQPPTPTPVKATRLADCASAPPVAALSASLCPPAPAEPRRQRHGRCTVWLLVPRGRGPLRGGRPGHLGPPGECPRGMRSAGCPGAGHPCSAPCPGVLGQSLAGGAGAGQRVCVSSCAMCARVRFPACVLGHLGVRVCPCGVCQCSLCLCWMVYWSVRPLFVCIYYLLCVFLCACDFEGTTCVYF